MRAFRVWRPGRLPYRDALVLQQRLLSERASVSYDSLLLLEHPPVITLGRSADRGHLRWSLAALEAAGIDCQNSSRGGDITLHSPGQLVGYPIVDLNPFDRDLHGYLRRLELLLIETLGDFGILAASRPGRTGVWVGARKIASIGIAVRHWTSWHGFALNVSNDLSLFQAIVPCGLDGVSMTSMTCELGRVPSLDHVSQSLIRRFAVCFDSVRIDDPDCLPAATPSSLELSG